MRALLLTLTLMMLAACGRSDSFSVTVEVEDLGVETLTLSYYSGGHVVQIRSHADKAGEPVKFKGSSKEYTLASIKRPDGGLIATFAARNGDKIKVTATQSEPPAIHGNAPCDSLTAFLTQHAALVMSGPSRQLSDTIGKYITDNTSSVVSALLLTTLFDASSQPEAADSLYSRLSTAVKTPGITDGWADQLSLATVDMLSVRIPPLTIYGKGDSIITFVSTSATASLLAFTPSPRPDSITRILSVLRRDNTKKRLAMLEIGLDTDSAKWNTEALRDTARWKMGWNPGGPASPALRRLSVPRMPFFIVADSTGTQIYRGPSVTIASNTIESILK